MGDVYLPLKEAAKVLGYSEVTLRLYARQGKIPGKQIEGHWQYPKSWVESRKDKGSLFDDEPIPVKDDKAAQGKTTEIRVSRPAGKESTVIDASSKKRSFHGSLLIHLEEG